jgi:hypothetical protein
LVIVSVVAVVLTGGIGMALASGGQITRPTTIEAVGKVTAFGSNDVNKKGPSIADSYALSGSMWNSSQTRRIGRFDVVCTLTTAKGGLGLCDATFTFAGKGEISASGVSP